MFMLSDEYSLPHFLFHKILFNLIYKHRAEIKHFYSLLFNFVKLFGRKYCLASFLYAKQKMGGAPVKSV